MDDDGERMQMRMVRRVMEIGGGARSDGGSETGGL